MKNFKKHTKRLCIRNLLLGDLEDFLVYRSDPEVVKYQGSDVMNEQEALEFILKYKDKSLEKNGEWVQFAIEIVDSGKLIGDCGIQLEAADPRLAQIGITINPQYQGYGYAKETMYAIMAWLFDHNNVHRIYEVVDVENIRSVNLLESLQFRREGHFRENIFFNGKWGSEYLYAMLHKEWKEYEHLTSET